MISKLVTMGSLVCAGTLAAFGGLAHADNINTSGVVCQNFNAAQALDIDYLTNSVRNIATTPRSVICSVPRSPLAAGALPEFFIDGQNSANTTTTCTLSVYNFSGGFVASTSFTEPATPGASVNWDHLVTFPVGALGTFDYVSVLCTIPASGNGLIYGATSVQ